MPNEAQGSCDGGQGDERDFRSPRYEGLLPIIEAVREIVAENGSMPSRGRLPSSCR